MITIKTGTSGDTLTLPVVKTDGTPWDLTTAVTLELWFTTTSQGIFHITATAAPTPTLGLMVGTVAASTFTLGGRGQVEGRIVWADTTISKTPSQPFTVVQSIS